jgi:excinuclease UvrABC ATPase subunit
MKEGRIFYQGSTEGIVDYFTAKGRICPDNYNPSDFVMNLIQSETTETLEENKLFMDISSSLLNDEGLKSTRLESEALEFQSESSFVRQILAISYREIINFFRDVPSLIARIGVTVILNVVYGLIFLGAGERDNADTENFNSHVGAISMLVIFSLFGSGQSVLLAFPFERPMILREYVTGTCKLCF